MKNILALVAVVALMTINLLAGVKVGEKATTFTLKNVDNSMVKLEDYQAEKGVILIFTCNHCPFSVAYEDRIIDLHKRFSSQGFPVVAINPNDPKVQPEDSFEKMQERSKDKKFPFRYLFDETQEIAKSYGATRTPHVFLLKKVGSGFEVAYIGAIDDNSSDAGAVKSRYLESAIEAIAKGASVDPSTTKAIGCSIKWKKQ